MKYNTTAACQQGKVEQVYIKSKCGHSILLDTVMCWTQQFTGSTVIWEFVLFYYFKCWVPLVPFTSIKFSSKSVNPTQVRCTRYNIM